MVAVRTAKFRALARRLHVEQARLVRLAEAVEKAGFVRTIGPELREQAKQIGLWRLTVDAVADAARDPRGARPLP